MKNSSLLAIDLGTTHIKLGLYDTMGGKRAVVRMKTSALQPAPGVYIQNGEDYFSSVIKGLRQLSLENPEE